MLLLPGCFYIQPIKERIVDKPPQVTIPLDTSSPVTLWVLNEPQRVSVVANDPEGQALNFVWNVLRANADVPGGEFQANNGDWVSWIDVPGAWLQDGDPLEVTISDEAQPRNVVTVEWTVRVNP